MINPSANISDHIFDADLPKVATRDGFGKGALEAGRADERVVVLTADLAESTRAEWFQKEFPPRFIEVGVAEQNMATVASGMANYGKIPFITSYAAFSPGRNWEQIRTTIALNNVPVIVCGMHAGISVGPDGATHQPLEDIALMRAMPNMTVIVPCDAEEGRKATIASAKLGTPVYLRFSRANSALFTTKETPFEIGRAEIFWQPVEKSRVLIVATGVLVFEALKAAHQLEQDGVYATVVNMHTIKPLDEETLVRLAQECGAVVTVEEHQKMGGLGSAVAEVLSRRAPTRTASIGVDDRFGQSGTPEELFAEYRLTSNDIMDAVKGLIA